MSKVEVSFSLFDFWPKTQKIYFSNSNEKLWFSILRFDSSDSTNWMMAPTSGWSSNVYEDVGGGLRRDGGA